MHYSVSHRRKRLFSKPLHLEALEPRQMLTIATFLPVQDTTLFENSTNAYGAGPDLFVGNTNAGRARRGLLQFDLSEQIPVGSVIYDAHLELFVTKSDTAPQTISLQPLLADWGEGSSSGTTSPSQGGGKGSPVTDGSANWQHRRYSSDTWSSPGGDFSSTKSASTLVSDVGSHTWQDDKMLEDIEAWIDMPEENFGWILTGDESAVKTTKRFGSRENGNTARRPVLTIDFDPPIRPLVSIEGFTADEGNENSNSHDFQITLSDFSPAPVTISYQTNSDTAIADEDFSPVSGELVFRPGDPLTQNISVAVTGDKLDEADEQFFLEMTGIQGPADFVGATLAVGAINDDDPLPKMGVESVELLEGADGTTAVELTVRLSEFSGREVTVQYETADDTAEADVDYQANSGQVTFAAGEDSQTITVIVNSDTEIEQDETFTLTLSDPENGQLTDQATATVTIQNDDFLPASPWQNKQMPEDVDNDGFIVPLDALLVINDLNNVGARALPNPPEPPNVPPPFIDVNGDDFVSPVDALMIINYLNAPPTAAKPAQPALATTTTGGSAEAIMSDHLIAAALADLDWLQELDQKRRTLL